MKLIGVIVFAIGLILLGFDYASSGSPIFGMQGDTMSITDSMMSLYGLICFGIGLGMVIAGIQDQRSDEHLPH